MQTQPTKDDVRKARTLIEDDATWSLPRGASSNILGTIDWLLIDADRRNALRVILDVFAH